MPDLPDGDWTTGPAKWVAVALLGTVSVIGLTYSIVRRQQIPAVPPFAGHVAGPHASPVSGPLSPSAPGTPTQPASPTRPATIIDLNSATKAELELLPGIGPALAQRILDHRAASGPFARVDDLDKVRGIGPRLLERLRPHIAAAPTPAPPAGTIPPSSNDTRPAGPP